MGKAWWREPKEDKPKGEKKKFGIETTRGPSEPTTTYSVSKTPCKEKPWRCVPRHIELVAFDADDTIWEIKPYGIASNITGKLKKIDEDTVEVEEPPYTPISFTTEVKPFPPTETLTQIWNDETGKWEWVHKKKKGQKLHPLRFTPSYLEEEEEEEEYNFESETVSPPETEAEVKEIAKELLESVPESKGKQIELTPLPAPRKGEWWKTPIGQPEKTTTRIESHYEPRKLTIKLVPGFRDLLDTLEKMGIKRTIISLNAKGSVSRIINAFGLGKKFTDITDSWEDKGSVFLKQTDANKICPCNALFVDNMQTHVETVSKKCGLSLVYGKDIKLISEIINYIKE